MSKNNKNEIQYIAYGVGYNQKIKGQKHYSTDTKIYEKWYDMMQRCYDPEYKKENPSYTSVYSVPEWHNFQVFAKWYEENYYDCNGETMCLDKDLFSNDKSICIYEPVKYNEAYRTNVAYYSPETCCFLPERLNLLFRTGVQELYSEKLKCIEQTTNGKYRLRYNNKYFGTFDNKRSAWLCYKLNKELVIQTRTEEYKDYLPKHIYDKLMEYEIEDPENNTWAIFNNCFGVDENETKKQSSDSNNPNND